MKLLFILLLSLFWGNNVCLAIAPVDNGMIKEAQIYGKIHSTINFTTFVLPWTAYEENAQKLDDTTEHAYLYTPFLLIASDTREKTLTSQTVKAADSNKILDQYSGYITFDTVLYGSTPQSFERLKCILIQDGKTIECYQTLIAEVGKAPWFPNQPLYLAKHYFYFLDEKIDLKKPATLVISTSDHREHKFHFNLNDIK